MLRLTLRTLLAYLDDTLDPAQAKQIGEKVAESEVAQELVERLKKVTRRRRLTAPNLQDVSDTEDPNTIAEYLDNILDSDLLAGFEKEALENDALLAEIATSHQILTLVLGEPVSVPMPARRRMYRLVKGPESIPYRQPAETPVAGIAAPEDQDNDTEEDILSGIFGARGALWLASLVVAVGLLMFAVWMAVPATPPPMAPARSVAVTSAKNDTVLPDPKPKPSEQKTESKSNDLARKDSDPTESKVDVPKVPVPVEPKPLEPKPDETKLKEKPMEKVVEPAPQPMANIPGPKENAPKPRVVIQGDDAPDMERKAVAMFDSPPQPLLAQPNGDEKWIRVDPDTPRIFGTDKVLALPGFRPEIKFDTGVRVQLWGNLPEFQRVPMLETAITPYSPRAGFDADLTLHAGRLFLTSRAGATIRVRFLDEIWDITLADGESEVAIDRFGTPGKGILLDRDELSESPRIVVYLGVIKGKATLKSGFRSFKDLTPSSKYKWDNKGAGLSPAPAKDDDESINIIRWEKKVPNIKDLSDAVREFTRRLLVGRGPIDLEFGSALKGEGETPAMRQLVPYFLQATENLAYLLDAAESDSAPIREMSIKSIQHWCAQSRVHEQQFIASLKERRGYTDLQSQFAVSMLRGAAPDKLPPDKVDVAFNLLSNDSLLMREIARLTLAKLDPLGAKESAYDATSDKRETQANRWKTMFKRRK